MYERSVGSRCWSYDPALVQQPVIPFSTRGRDMVSTGRVKFHMLRPMGNGLSQASIKCNVQPLESYVYNFQRSGCQCVSIAKVRVINFYIMNVVTISNRDDTIE